MSKTLVFNIEVENSGAIDNLKRVSEELETLKKKRQELLQSNLSLEEITKETANLDSQISKLNKTYEEITKTTVAYAEAQKEEIQSLEEQKKATENVKNAQEKFEKSQKTLERTTKTITGTIGVASGVLGAFGVKNEEVEQALLKVQSAANFSNGVKDLSEAFKGVNLSFSTLTKRLLLNAFALIAAAVIGLVSALGLVKPILDGIKAVIEPLSDGLLQLSRNLGLSSSAAADAAEQVAEYEAALNSLNFTATVTNALLEEELILAEARGASEEQLLAIRQKIAKQAVIDAEEEIRLNTIRIEQLKELIISEELQGKEKIDIENQIAQIKQKNAQLSANIITTQAKATAEDIKLKRQRAKEEEDENKKAIDDNKAKNDKLSEEEKKRLEELKRLQDEGFKEVQKRLDSEIQLREESGKQSLDRLKEQLLEGTITEETFNAEKLLLEKRTNDDILQFRESFRLTSDEQLKIGLKNTEKINADNQKAILDLTRKNLDTDLIIKKNNDAAELKSTQDTQKDKIETFEREWLQKKIDLLNVEGLAEEELALKLKEFEINKNKAKLEELEKGSSEYLALKLQITEQEIALDDKVAENKKKKEEEARQDAIETQNLALELGKATFDSLSTFTDIYFTKRKKEAEGSQKAEEALAKKQFQINKSLQLGTAIINGIQSILAITSVPDFTLGVQSALRIGAQVALNAASIAKIASTKFESTGSASASSSVSASSLAVSGSITPTQFQPTVFGTGQSQQGTLGGQNGNGGRMVVRAFVTESDIQNTNRRLSNIRNASEL
jgi:hypothetical protein